jgi:hypothetical protein
MKKIYLNYSSKDRHLVDKCIPHLKSLGELWSVDNLNAGDIIDKTITKKWNESDFVLEFISSDFIYEPCFDIEPNNKLLIGIYLRPCSFEDVEGRWECVLPFDALNSSTDFDSSLNEIIKYLKDNINSIDTEFRLKNYLNENV